MKTITLADIAVLIVIGAGLFIALAILKDPRYSALVVGGTVMWGTGSFAGIATLAGVFGQLRKDQTKNVIGAACLTVLLAIALMLLGGASVAKFGGIGIALSVLVCVPGMLAAKFGDR